MSTYQLFKNVTQDLFEYYNIMLIQVLECWPDQLINFNFIDFLDRCYLFESRMAKLDH